MVLLGDDAEADAFVYSLFADVCAGAVSADTLAEVMRRGGAYEDTILDAVRFAGYVEKGPVVTRILIHLDRQSSPSDFRLFGPARGAVLQLPPGRLHVLHEDGFIPAKSVLRVAQDLAFVHNFDSGFALAQLPRHWRAAATSPARASPSWETPTWSWRGAGARGRARWASWCGKLQRVLPDLTPPPQRDERADRLRPHGGRAQPATQAVTPRRSPARARVHDAPGGGGPKCHEGPSEPAAGMAAWREWNA